LERTDDYPKLAGNSSGGGRLEIDETVDIG